MTAKYSQSIACLGIRATVEIEITNDAYEQFNQEAVKHAIGTLSDAHSTFLADTSATDAKKAYGVDAPSIRTVVEATARNAHRNVVFALDEINQHIDSARLNARTDRSNDETQQESEKRALAQVASDLSAQNVRLSEQNTALQAKLNSAIELSEAHEGASKRLADKVEALQNALKKQEENKTKKSRPGTQSKRASGSKSKAKKA